MLAIRKANPQQATDRAVPRKQWIAVSLGALSVLLALSSCTCTPNEMNAQGTMPDHLRMNHLTSITPDNASALSLVSQMGKGTDSCMSWSADGNDLVLVSRRGVFTYDGSTLEMTGYVPVDMSGMCCDITADGKYVVTSKPDGKLEVLETKSGRVIRELMPEDMDEIWVGRVMISPHGRWVTVQKFSEPDLELWDVSTGKLYHEFDSSSRVRTFDSSERLLAFNAVDRQDGMINYEVEVWDVESLRLVQTLPTRAYGWLAFSSDDELLITQDTDHGVVQVWNLETSEAIQEIAVDSPYPQYWADMDCDSDVPVVPLVSAREVQLWNAETGEILRQIGISDAEWARFVFSPDCQQVAVRRAFDKDCVTVHDLTTGEVVGAVTGHASAEDLVFHPNAPLLAIGWDDNKIWLVDMTTGKTDILEAGESERESLVTFSPDGSLLATGSSEGIVYLWDVATRAPQLTLHPGGRVRSLSFSSNGDRLAVVAGEYTRMWRAGSDDLVKGGCFDCDTIFLFSPAGDLAARVDWFSTVSLSNQILWSTEITKEHGNLTPEEDITSLAFRPDGEMLAAGFDIAGTSIGKVRIWSVETRQELYVFEHSSTVRDVAFSPDGSLLASASTDGVSLWEVETGQLAATVSAQSASSLAFSSDGRILAIATSSGIVSLWMVD